MARNRKININEMNAQAQAAINASIADSKKRGRNFQMNKKADELISLVKTNSFVYATKRFYDEGVAERHIYFLFKVEGSLRKVEVESDYIDDFRRLDTYYFDDIADLEYFIKCRMTTPTEIGVDDRGSKIA